MTFENSAERESFLEGLRRFLMAIGLRLDGPETSIEKAIKLKAVTKAKRQETLNKFFADIFAQVRASLKDNWNAIFIRFQYVH